MGTNGNGNGASDRLDHLRDGKVRVAIVGVGNCASSLVQGVQYYRDAKADDFVPGLMHVDLGGYHIRDIEFVGGVRHRRRQGRQGPLARRSSAGRTTRSSSPTCRTSASRCSAA